MDINFKKYKDNLLFVPLGGSGEIGMNLNLYHINGEWIMVDCGIGFADDNFPGADIILPNIEFVEKIRKNLHAVIITHAHEDHVGALHYLWDRIKKPIYTSNFTSHIIKSKFSSIGINKDIPLNVVENGTTFTVGPFSMEFVQITHSIPEMNAVFIQTKHGNVFHTGDWKFDSDPVVGKETDYKHLKKIGEKGVTAFVGDSTNIFNEGYSGSEGELKKSLKTLIKERNHGLVIVSTFASNVARIASIAAAARDCGRRVALLGRSLWRIYRAARESGYLIDVEEFISEEEIKNHKREKLLVISTGCQGEELAATNKIANKTHPKLHVTKEDFVIFSSKIIPGNEKKIFELFNKFCGLGVEVMTERDHFVHVSGHPARDEVEKMYSLIKPKIAIPVHGEAVHIHEHAKFAREKCKIESSIEPKNGDVIKIEGSKASKIGRVKSGYLALDGLYLVDEDSIILKERKSMVKNGIVFLSVFVDNKGNFKKDPVLMAPGLFDEADDKELIQTICAEVCRFSCINLSENEIAKKSRMIASKIIKKETGKYPDIHVLVNTI